MFFPSLKSNKTHWVYDDPSGATEGPLTVSLPEPLRAPVEEAAATAGLTPSDWLTLAISRSLRPTTVKAI